MANISVKNAKTLNLVDGELRMTNCQVRDVALFDVESIRVKCKVIYCEDNEATHVLHLTIRGREHTEVSIFSAEPISIEGLTDG